jgi:outer membrane protein assembly factor BamD (BamD/ComL family)
MKNVLGFLFIILLVTGCANPKKQMITRLSHLETDLEKGGFSKQKADQLIANYNSYIQQFPTDTTSRIYMAKGTELSIRNNDPMNALKFIDLFLKTFPNDRRAPLMQFKKGLVYDLLIHDPLRAVAEYDICIKKYPNDPVRVDAENAILLIQNPQTYMEVHGIGTDSTANKPQNQ